MATRIVPALSYLLRNAATPPVKALSFPQPLRDALQERVSFRGIRLIFSPLFAPAVWTRGMALFSLRIRVFPCSLQESDKLTQNPNRIVPFEADDDFLVALGRREKKQQRPVVGYADFQACGPITDVEVSDANQFATVSGTDGFHSPPPSVVVRNCHTPVFLSRTKSGELSSVA